MNATTPPDESVIGLNVLLIDSTEDAETFKAFLPGVTVLTFDEVLDDDDAMKALEAADVIALVPGDAGAALRVRASDAIRKARTKTDHHKALAVLLPPWKAGTPLPTPKGIDTPGSFLAWARAFPPMEQPPTTPANGKAATAGPAVAAIGDDDAPLDVPGWPDPPADTVFHGPAGKIVRVLEPHTEADPLAILAQLLIGFGNLVGRGPYVEVDGACHRANENAILVGQTSAGRKGTSWGRAREPLRLIDPDWVANHVRRGLSSGEGLIGAVRDPIYKSEPIKESKQIVGYQDVMIDAGVSDKRLLVLETEFGGTLSALEREGNKLSSIICQAWDDGGLSSMTKIPQLATDAHVSILGHITFCELRAKLSRVNIANGFANRFLWLPVRRSRILPFGSKPPSLDDLADGLGQAAIVARDRGEIGLSRAARDRWFSEYERLTTPPPGALGDILNRAAPHVLRLAMIYALIDGDDEIGADHLEAALALWDAADRGARYIFGDHVANPDAGKILTELREAAPDGLTRTQISAVFNRNLPAARIKAALETLIQSNLVQEQTETTGGRTAARYFATTTTKETNSTKKAPPEAPPAGLNSSNSSISYSSGAPEAPKPGKRRVVI